MWQIVANLEFVTGFAIDLQTRKPNISLYITHLGSFVAWYFRFWIYNIVRLRQVFAKLDNPVTRITTLSACTLSTWSNICGTIINLDLVFFMFPSDMAIQFRFIIPGKVAILTFPFVDTFLCLKRFCSFWRMTFETIHSFLLIFLLFFLHFLLLFFFLFFFLIFLVFVISMIVL